MTTKIPNMTKVKKLIYLLPQRLIHALIGVSCLILFITAKLATIFFHNGELRHQIWIIHITIGYILITSLTVRILMFFIGPQYSKFSELIKFKEWTDILKNKKIDWKWGHHPIAAFAYIGLYLGLIYMSYSGLFLGRIIFDIGPISEKYFDQVLLIENFLELHDSISLCIVLFSIAHISALFWHQYHDYYPVFKSMWNGYQYKKSQEDLNDKY